MRSLLFLLGAALLCACSEGTRERVSGVDLLAREPDERIEQPGALVPDEERQWGEYGQFGWERATEEQRGRDFVWSNRAEAFLRLPCGTVRRERTLVLSLFGPSSEPSKLEVRLNGVVVGTLAMTSELAEHRIPVPESAWIVGDNLLAFSCELTQVADGSRKVGVALARVEYDVRHVPDVAPEERIARLPSETALHYRVQPLVPGRLTLRARVEGAGTLAAELVRVDPATGDESSAEPQVVVVPSAQDVERAYVLPSDGHLTEVRIGWTAQPGSGKESRLVLLGLEVEEFETAPRPPIVLISIDTLSARHLSVYGYPLATDPALARFAEEAFVFQDCMTNAPWTLPSFMSLMTGIYANANRLDGTTGGELWERWYLSQNRWTLAEFLRAAGYRTAGFVDNTWITESFGFPQGFEVYDWSAGENNENKMVDPEGGMYQTTAAARGYLDELAPDQPFFLFVHGFDAHGPYGAPQDLHGCFDEQAPYDAQRTAFAGGPANAFGIIPTYIAVGEVPEGPIPPALPTAPFEAAYDEGIRHVDNALAKFFEDLRARGLFDRAWIIVTADHGETMAAGDYLFGHGVLDQDVVHVPLIVRPPGGKPGGARIPQTVQLADVYPTILELLGSTDSTGHLHGRSLLPFLEGEERPPSVVLTESGIMRQAMLLADGWKLVELEPTLDAGKQVLISHPMINRNWVERTEDVIQKRRAGGRELGWRKDPELVRDLFERLPETGLTDQLFADMQSRPGWDHMLWMIKRGLGGPFYKLYDLRADPEAREDLSRQRPDKLEEMKQLLVREQARREVAKKNARPPTQAIELDQESIDDLQALGYGGDSEGAGPDDGQGGSQ